MQMAHKRREVQHHQLFNERCYGASTHASSRQSSKVVRRYKGRGGAIASLVEKLAVKWWHRQCFQRKEVPRENSCTLYR
jgi:hypothetical protein